MRMRHGWVVGALAIAALGCGAALAGGADCHGKDAAAQADMHGHDAASCPLMKDVTKTASMTDKGAVVTLAGKTDAAVKAIHEHLAKHGEHGGCPDCPVSMEGVASAFKMTEKGGELTLTGSTPETVKAVQEWAGKPVASCCARKKTAA